jgi:hypothetical protein
LDRGYDAPPIRALAVAHGFTPPVRARGEQIKLKAQTPGGAPDAGSSACHSWMNHNRGRLIR